ncbi:MAG: hypothetical protein IPG60_00375 [Bacteroidetes bacterium]|nr:hypothetical protein [Bacteroidota bacterium]
MKKLLPVVLIVAGLFLVASALFFPISLGGGRGDLDVDIVKTSFIMPAAHNVYSNPDALNGKYYLFKVKITNVSNVKMEDVMVRYRVPGYIEWTELGVIGEMFPDQSAVVVCYPKFNDDITTKTNETTEKAEIEIDWKGASDDDIIEEEFAFKITDRNKYVFTNVPAEEILGWGDVFSNDDLLACYVTPNDPIVSYYTQILQEKVLKGETASVTKQSKEAVRFLAGIYQATLMTHMVYSGTKGVPSSLDDVQSFSQQNRLPREVITGNTGLCLELSILYASILSHAGIDPLIFLIPGHAYPGFKMNGEYYAIEATGIGGEGIGQIADVESAFNTGMKELQEFFQKASTGDPRYTIVDIHALNQQGAVPMSLKDDQFLREKVDQLAMNFGVMNANLNQAPAKNTQGGGGGGGGNNNGGNDGGGNDGGGGGNNKQTDNNNNQTSSQQRTPGPLSAMIPSGWQYVNRPNPDMPIFTGTAVAPDQSSNIGIYDLPASNMQDGLAVIEQYFSYWGSTMRYNFNGNTASGQTYSDYGTFTWKAKGTTTSNGYRIVAIGCNQNVYNQMSSTIDAIYQSIK